MPGYELLGQEEFAEIQEIFEKSRILFRHGFDNLRNGVYKVRDFEKAFSSFMNQPDALAVTSGTAALKVALKALGVGQGDEVITQAFTFVATPEAIIEAGAQPVIAEIDLTLNMDPTDLERKITPKTKGIIVVHMLGVPARMDAITAIAKRHGLFVMEDTAWGCGAQLNGEYLGTIGDVGTYSFDFAKTMTTGEGGMIVCKNQAVLERAKAYHDHGHENNPSLPRWEDSRSGSGFNYRMTELQGAVGLAQLRKLPKVIEAQRKQKEMLKEVIGKFSGISFREQPTGTTETSDALVFFVQTPDVAKALRASLLKHGFGTKILPEAISWHFAGTWTHMPELTKRYVNLSTAFPRSLEILSRSVALPISVYLPDDTADRVERALREVL